MADTSDFRNGLIIKFKNDLFTIVSFQHVKPGKGGAFVRTTLKSLKTGKQLENTFRAGENVETVRVERRKYQFLYRDSAGLMCMDQDTYEQIPVQDELFGEGVKFLKEGTEVELLLDDNDQIVNAELPFFIELVVKKTEPGVRGDTATNVTKPATLETGAVINVPIFINEGEVIKIDTRTGGYVERVKK